MRKDIVWPAATCIAVVQATTAAISLRGQHGERKREELREALRREPASPYRWCELGEAVLEDGQKEQERYGFQQAEKPAPKRPPMWMRAAFFHFQMEETEAAIQCSARVLKTAPDYDQAIFNYYDRLAPSVEEVLPHLGDHRRAGQAYFRHLLGAEATGWAATAWEWLREQRFADDGLAVDYLDLLRKPRMAEDAVEVWASFLGRAQGRLPRIPTSCSMAISRARRPARRWTGGLRRCAARRRRGTIRAPEAAGGHCIFRTPDLAP
jgi:tetratricopeptide (TPR) repeat protein